MDQYKKPLFTGLLVFAAFIWGYKGDRVASGWNSMFSSKEPTIEPTSVRDTAVQDTAQDHKQSPKAISPAQARIQSRESNFSPSAQQPSMHNHNDAMDFYRSLTRPPNSDAPRPMHPSLSYEETFRSRNPGEVNENTAQRRNLYFEKLSEQLKELQGQRPAQEQMPTPPLAPLPSQVQEPFRPTQPSVTQGQIPHDEFIDDYPYDEFEFDPHALDNLTTEDLLELERALSDFE
jgi:hypothetical protein